MLINALPKLKTNHNIKAVDKSFKTVGKAQILEDECNKLILCIFTKKLRAD
jgi:hypothetical protein